MEDEECLPENSGLKLYLQSLGFTDFPISKIAPKDSPATKVEVHKLKTNFVETIDEDVIDQINIIISTQMLFEEDISKVENLLTNFRVVKNGMLKSMFKNLFGFAVVFLGLCLFWVIGYYAFFVVSSFYGFIAADYLSRKHFRRRRLKKLTSVLLASFVLLKRIVQFIKENRLLEVSVSCTNNSAMFTDGFDFYNNFKSDFLESLNEMISILLKSTQKLIIKIPLYNHIENPEYYLCNNFNKNNEFSKASNLYEIYLLAQSEFLHRLILSLIPNIKLSQQDSYHELNKIITETCVSLLKLKNKLNRKFKFLFLNGIHSIKPEVQFRLPFSNSFNNSYFNEFILSVHEASKIFQKLLLECRILEEKLMSNKNPEFIEKELVKIQHNVNACQANITDSLLLFKKSNMIRHNSCKRKKIGVQNEEELENSIEKLSKIIVGYSDFDPKVEDEIFEAYFGDEKSTTNSPDINLWDVEERLQKKQERELFKNIIDELKLRIKEKARYWKKKERELLEKNGANNLSECEQTEISDMEKEYENNKEKLVIQKLSESLKLLESSESNDMNNDKKSNGDDFCLTETVQESLESHIKQQTFQKNYTDENFGELEVNNEKDNLNSTNKCMFNQICESSNQSFNNNFLDDLKLARQRIFKSCVDIEEELYFAGESSSEDNHSS